MEAFHESPLYFSANDENKNHKGLECHGSYVNEITTNAPRKKILGERNGCSSGTISNPNSPHKPLNSNPSPNPNQMSCGGTAGSEITHDFTLPLNSSSSKISKSDLELAPYDPTTNFLSPRPKFLRYNPNRRRHILVRRERIESLSSDAENQSHSDRGESSGTASFSSSSSSPEGDLRIIKGENCEENEGLEMEKEEDEEVEVVSLKGLNWALKCLLVLAVLFVSTTYICTMNSPSPPAAILAIRGLRDDCQRVGGGVLNSFFHVNTFELGERGFLNGTVGLDVGLCELRGYSNAVAEDRKEEGEGEVESDEMGNEGGSDEEDVKETSDALAVYVENRVILEELDLLGNEISEAEVSDEMTEEKNDSILEEVDLESESHASFGGEESLEEEEEVNDEAEKEQMENEAKKDDQLLLVSKHLHDLHPWLTTKNAIWVAISCLLVGVGASLFRRFLQLNPQKTPSKTPDIRRCTALGAEAGRPRKSATPEVKLIGELELGSSPRMSLPLSFGSDDLTFDSAHSSYGSFITEEKIAQKRDKIQLQGPSDMGGLSSTPVRRSMRIRSRKLTSP